MIDFIKNTKIEAEVYQRTLMYRAVAEMAGKTFNIDEYTADGRKNLVIDNTDEEMTVRINGPIDSYYGVNVNNIISEMDKNSPKNIRFLIDSPGGFLDEGVALYSDLRARVRDGATVIAEVRGMAASAATLPFMAADQRIVMPESQVMIHSPFVAMFLVGTADDIESSAGTMVKALRAGEKQLLNVYTERTSMTKDEVNEAVKATTFYVGEEAVAPGIATEFVESRREKKKDETPLTNEQKEAIINNMKKIINFHDNTRV